LSEFSVPLFEANWINLQSIFFELLLHSLPFKFILKLYWLTIVLLQALIAFLKLI